MIGLKRIAETPDGTFGVLMQDGVPFALTCERPWLDNARNVSCIAGGAYQCIAVDSPKFGVTYEVTGVPGRSGILFHKGNTSDDSHGCILIGEEFGEIGGRTAVISSAKGFAEFIARLKGVRTFKFEITDMTGGRDGKG